MNQFDLFNSNLLDLRRVPDALKERDQWVLYKLLPTPERPGKFRKIPMQPNGNPASVADPATWSSFSAVVEHLDAQKNLHPSGAKLMDGIGFVFNGSGACGIDLDNVVQDDGLLHPRAKELLDSIPGYKELSPSGRGIHIITLGSPPWTGQRSAEIDVEVYTDKRFFTVTTQTIMGSSATLETSVDLSALASYDAHRSPEKVSSVDPFANLKEPDPSWTLERVRDELLAKLPDYPYPQWRRVACALHHQFRGDLQAYELFDEYSSRGDRYTGSSDTRKLWDQIDGAPGKNAVTIATLIHIVKANTDVSRVLEQSTQTSRAEPLLMSLKDAKRQIRSVDWVVDQVIKSESLVMLAGAPGGGKSYFALDLGLSVATGKRWMDQYETKQGDVIFVACEGRDSMLRRSLAWESLKNDGKDVDHAYITRTEIVVGSNPEAENSTEELSRFIEDKGIKPRLIFIDTMNYTLGRFKENDSNDMTAYFQTLARNLIRKYGATVVLVHHTNKDAADIRGSTAIRGALDFLAMVKQKDGQFVFQNVKHKDREELAPMYFESRSTLISLADGKVEENMALFPAAKRIKDLALTAGQRELIDCLKQSVGIGGCMQKKTLRQRLGVESGNWARDYVKPLVELGYLQEVDKVTLKLLKTGDSIDDDFND